jgi:hypothetical protein
MHVIILKTISGPVLAMVNDVTPLKDSGIVFHEVFPNFSLDDKLADTALLSQLETMLEMPLTKEMFGIADFKWRDMTRRAPGEMNEAEFKKEYLNDWEGCRPDQSVVTKQQEYWREQSERAVDPKHYKGYFKEHQWVDTMREITPMKMGDRFRGALEFTVRGYLDRCGQKDDELQELNKALFYFMYLVKYVEGAKFDAESIHKWRNAHVELDT